MHEQKLLIIAGTHGNEINPIWAVNQFKNRRVSNKSRRYEIILGNPLAIEKGLRYVDIDLNRSFNIQETKKNINSYEINRAKYLVDKYGSQSVNAYQIAIDLHTTTANMGTSLVIYGRREKDFCLAAILQYKFGLPIYLHEKDQVQNGFLVEAWPCGLVIEIGPVAQNHYDPEIVQRFMIILEFIEQFINNFDNLIPNLPDEVTVFVHQYSIDYPRDTNHQINGLIHPSRVNQDWQEIKYGDPLFLTNLGKTIIYENQKRSYPVFIGEAAYREKKIAMSFTKKEIYKFKKEWMSKF